MGIFYSQPQTNSDIKTDPPAKPPGGEKFGLIIVDLQYDFINGSLAVADGEGVVPVVNDLIKSNQFDFISLTQDWHPANHCSFFENLSHYPLSPKSPISAKDAKLFDEVIQAGPPEIPQVLWPTHCVQGTHGAKFHSDLIMRPEFEIVEKGTYSGIDSYSGFWDNGKGAQTRLAQTLRARGITTLFITGIALDYCVGFTALHAKEEGFRSIVVLDATRSVASPSTEAMMIRLKNGGVEIIHAAQVPSFLATPSYQSA